MPTYSKPKSIIPVNDKERLAKLQQYEILDTPAENAFDKIALLAAQIFDTPSAFVTFVDKDRVWFKSNFSSLEGNSVFREDSLCSLAILQDQPTFFSDTHKIPDLLSSPLVNCEGGIRFYAGAPLKTAEGHNMGTICVVDSKPREATEQQINMLKTLSSIIIDELELRLATKKAIRVQTDLMNIAVHDLKNPASAILALSKEIPEELDSKDTVNEMANMISTSSEKILHSLDEMLEISRIENGDIEVVRQPIDVPALLKSVVGDFEILAKQKGQEIIIRQSCGKNAKADKLRIREVFENLLSNCIKYSYSNSIITLNVIEEKEGVQVQFCDQGQGLSEKDMEKLFTKFSKLSATPTGKETSTGLGLSIVKMLVELNKGKVWAESPGKGKGSKFIVQLPYQ